MAHRTASVLATHSTSTAINAVDVDQSTYWTPATTDANVKIYGDLGASYNIGGFGFGNAVDWSGETINIRKDVSLGGAVDTLISIATAPSNKDFLVSNTAISLRYWSVLLPTAILATLKLASLSVLDSDAILEFTPGSGVEFPLIRNVDPGYHAAKLAAGTHAVQVLGGPVRTYGFSFQYLNATDGNLFDDLMDSLANNLGWAHGAWITDDTFNDTTKVGRSYYVRPVPGSLATGQISEGPYGRIAIEFEEIPRGVTA